MKSTHSRLLGVLFAAAVLTVTGVGSVRAYLSPVNPLVNSWDPNQTKFMPPSYTADYNPVGNPAYVIGPGKVPDYLTTPNWANTPPIRKFVDSLPGLTAAGANNLGQYLPVAKPDIVTYPGSDYYEIELREFTEKMHSDLSPTTLRGYIQVNQGTDTSSCTDPSLNQPNPCTAANNTLPLESTPHYLGPVIVARKDRPVRVKFINKLPIGAGGDLFVPVDQSIMGAGRFEIDYDPVTKQPITKKSGTFTQNRAELHLHGGRTPWISDGTPHQWITPAGEVTDYPTGISVENVPDMPDPGPGAQTYYWTNQQSSRMMFFHDHAWGITRVNVYVGEAAGYLLRDAVEQDLIDRGIIPGTRTDGTVVMGGEIPLVIQDKTFVDANPASPTYVWKTDPTWNWGTGARDQFGNITEVKDGDLWWPHVYMPAQNPFDITGIAPMGRWAYGPYFWPATNNPYQPIPNPYFNPNCNVDDPAQTPADTPGMTEIQGVRYCQPPEIPSSPNPSWGAEAFMDTPTVNGTAYPYLVVEPKSYRFRILNAAHDRFFNLQMYVAADKNTPTTAETSGAATALCTGSAVPAANCTEVKMLPAVTYLSDPAWPATWPADGRPGGIPDWNTKGPDWIVIGNEGGFLPRPVVVPSHPVTWNNDVTTFNAGNVNGGSLILGPAERADVIVDFSQYAGQTLILYNDAPAPWPALDPHYDYYTDPNLDNTGMGGAPPTLPGYGPNTRTIMQIRVSASAPDTQFDTAALFAEFVTDGTKDGVFKRGQEPLIVGQGDMNKDGDPAKYEAFLFDGVNHAAIKEAYNLPFPANWPNWGISRINDKVLYFTGTDGSTTYNYNPADLTPLPWDSTRYTYGGLPMKFKAIQDEQGETFDEFGRMRAGLGLELITPGANRVNFIVQTYSDPSTELLAEDGIQVWKITHNGVDTHPIHFHLFDVQVLNRVGWDGFIRLPDPTEIGWKETVRISPLEDTIVALKPVKPRLPFGVPDSYRPLNPATPLGDTTELSLVDPTTGQAWATPNVNRFINMNWEYVWHCHILSHEENDMMRPIQFNALKTVPDPFSQTTPPTFSGGNVTVAWNDPTPVTDANTPGNPKNEIGFRIERCGTTNPAGCGTTDTFETVARALANQTSYTDTTLTNYPYYTYRVVAWNAAGETVSTNMVTTGTTDVIAGVCGASHGGTFTSAPTTGLCSYGAPSAVSGTGPWTWTCGGVNGGAQADCAANLQQWVVSFAVNANGTLTGDTIQLVNHGGNSTAVVAVPVPGYRFLSWKDGLNAIVSTVPSFTATNVTANQFYTAFFYVPKDYNNDGKADILWTNGTTNETRAWLMDNAARLAEVTLPAPPAAPAPSTFVIQAAADFNHDGQTDLIYRNQTTGQTVLRLMNGVNTLSDVTLPSLNVNWEVAGAGDFNGDGHTDILWRRHDRDTNNLFAWYMNNTAPASVSAYMENLNRVWRVGGVADFNADGKTDILWRRTDTDTNNSMIWMMNGVTRTSTVNLPNLNRNWRVGAVADFNRDGNPDIAWRRYDRDTNNSFYWYMNNAGAPTAASSYLPNQPAVWTMVGR